TWQSIPSLPSPASGGGWGGGDGPAGQARGRRAKPRHLRMSAIYDAVVLIRNRSGSFGAVPRSGRGRMRGWSEFRQDDDLLQYLLRKSGADPLDIADHLGDRLILKALPEQDRDLRGQ